MTDAQKGQLGCEDREPRSGSSEALALDAPGLTKRFGERAAFSHLSFSVGHGEVFGFLGPNGAGKTTAVRTPVTLLAPTSGSATVAGAPLGPHHAAAVPDAGVTRAGDTQSSRARRGQGRRPAREIVGTR